MFKATPCRRRQSTLSLEDERYRSTFAVPSASLLGGLTFSSRPQAAQRKPLWELGGSFVTSQGPWFLIIFSVQLHSSLLRSSLIPSYIGGRKS
jgi:hypothetical protein